MRCNPFRWVWGLPLLAMLVAMTALSEQGRIEKDLTQRATLALKAAGVDGWAAVAFQGRDGVLAGKATEEKEPSAAYEAVRAVWGVRTIDNQTALIDKAENYLWSAQLVDGHVRLGGYVPNEETRRTILGVAKAKFANRQIDDAMKLARGAPERDKWLGGVGFGLEQLTRLKTGRVELDGTNLVVDGETDVVANYHSLRTALASNLPSGIKLKEEKVRPPVVSPYIWGAKLADNKLELLGFAPNDRTRETVFSAAKKSFANVANISDRMEIASGEPRRWEPMLAGALDALSKLEQGVIEITDSKVKLSGLAATDAQAEAARKLVRSPSAAGATYDVADSIRSREGEARAEAEAKRKVEEAEAKRKADEAAKIAADAEAKRKADDAVKLAADADAKRKADEAAKEQARLASDPEAKRKADELAKAKADAEAQAKIAAAADVERKRQTETAALAEKSKLEAQRCQTQVSDLAHSGQIKFERASATLSDQSYAILDRLAQAIQGCAATKVEVQGHTDAEGTPERNKNLSERRAQSVRDYLAKAGVTGSRMTAVGYGETRPIASNDTADNRAKNRRIEFEIQSQ